MKSADVRVDLYGTEWRFHAEVEWRAFYVVRDSILPNAMQEAAVRVLEHPGQGTWAWEIRDLAERVACDDTLPQEVRDRMDAYKRRWGLVRWSERAVAAGWKAWNELSSLAAWKQVYGVGVYFFVYPPNWFAFSTFPLLVAFGRKLVRSCRWRSAGFVALAVIVLMPVKVPA